MTTEGPADRVEPRRRSRKVGRLLVVLVVMLVLAGLFVVADRGVQRLAEDRVAAQIQTQLGVPGKPGVDLGPFPFLNEIATGHIDSARVRIDEVALPDSNGATVTGVDATFTGTTVSDRFSRIVADQGQASGLLSYPSLSVLTGLDVAYAGTDRVQIRFESVIGRWTVSGTVTGRPVLDVEKQSLEIADAQVSVTSEGVPQPVADAAGQFVLRRVPLDALPYELRLTSIAVREDGVQVAATGQDLPLRG